MLIVQANEIGLLVQFGDWVTIVNAVRQNNLGGPELAARILSGLREIVQDSEEDLIAQFFTQFAEQIMPQGDPGYDYFWQEIRTTVLNLSVSGRLATGSRIIATQARGWTIVELEAAIARANQYGNLEVAAILQGRLDALREEGRPQTRSLGIKGKQRQF